MFYPVFRIPAIEEICKEAYELAKKLGHINGSIRRGGGNWVGYAFQVAYAQLYNMEWSDHYHFDLTSPAGVRKECKAKDRKDQHTKLGWEVSVAHNAGLGTRQQCDRYAFGQVSTNSQKVPTWIWFLGEMDKKDFFEGYSNQPQISGEKDTHNRPLKRWKDLRDGAEFRIKGLEYDKNNFICQEDCWNRRAEELDPLLLKNVPNVERLREILEIAKKERWSGCKVNGVFQRPTNRYLLGQQDDLILEGTN